MAIDAGASSTPATAASSHGDRQAPRDVSAFLAGVPHDPWQPVRLAAMAGVAVTYLWWSRTQGLVTDRISATVAVGVFVVAAFVGHPWRRWGQVAVDAVAYALLWFAYESSRGIADGLGMPLQLHAMRSADGLLFLGTQPTEWTQQAWLEPGVIHWYDLLLSFVYYTHFVVPVIAVAAVWAVSRTMWLRYLRRLATVIGVACMTFVVLPTVPPWMASDERFGFGVGERLIRHTRRGIVELGFGGFAHDWGVALDWSNAVAAMPSLHAAFSLFVVVFVAPLVPRRVRVLLWAYPITMAVALVYFAEHWVIDVLAGWLLVAASFAVWARIEARWRRRDVDTATAALPALGTLASPTGRTDAVRDPIVVALDQSYLSAIVDTAVPGHDAALAHYRGLLERHLADRIRLVARADHLATSDVGPHRGLLAPVAAVHVAGQYRRQAARRQRDHRVATGADASPPDALTLVTARRAGARELYVV